MARRPSSAKPRKMPTQARSRATVDAIVQAATYILTEQGWEGLTTNAIAERAGVNIGSLYQFFPNKEAVIVELKRRHLQATHAALGDVLAVLPQLGSLREIITMVVEMTVAEHRVAPAVHKAMEEELPRAVREVEVLQKPDFPALLSALKPFLQNVPDPELTLYLLGVAAHGLIHTVTAQRPELLDHPRLVSELVVMFESYLCRPPQG